MQIEELNPIILTKDAEWAKQHIKADEGAIIVLPEDAVLVRPKLQSTKQESR